MDGTVVVKALHYIGKVVSWTMIVLVRFYQVCISPILPPLCKYEPSCSRYMIDAIRARGPVVGLLKGAWRVLRCNPFSRGGFDPVDKGETWEQWMERKAGMEKKG